MGTPTAAHATPESSIQASQDSRGTEYTSFRPFETYRNGRGNARQPQRKREREDDSDDDDDLNEECPGNSPTQASSPRTILPIKRRSNPKGTAATSSPVSPSKSSGPTNAESGSSNTGFSSAGVDLEAQTSTGESHGLNLYPFPLPQFDGASGSRPWGPYTQQAAPQQQSAVPLVPLGGAQAQAADPANDNDDDDDDDDGQLPPNPAPTPVTAQAPAPAAAAPPNPAPQKRTCFCLDPESCNPMCCVTWCQRLTCGNLSFNKRLLLLFAIVMVGLTIAYFYLVKDHFLPKDKDKQG